MTIIRRRQFQRRGSASQWNSVNPILGPGEIGVEEGPPIKIKVGNGTDAWNALDYFGGGLQDPGATWVRQQGAIDAGFANDVLRLIPREGRITGVYVMTQPAAGNCVIDIFKGSFGSFPSDATITASAKPMIIAGRTYSDTTLTGWATAVDAFDFLRFRLVSSSVFTSINIALTIE